MKNTNLHRAKREKNDEFYTRYEDIEKEVKHYNLSGMSVYSPCDDYRFSNFKKYFVDNFKTIGITKYCCTNYDIEKGFVLIDEFIKVNKSPLPIRGNKQTSARKTHSYFLIFRKKNLKKINI